MFNVFVDEVIFLERFLVFIESIERVSGLFFVLNILVRAGRVKVIIVGSK